MERKILLLFIFRCPFQRDSPIRPVPLILGCIFLARKASAGSLLYPPTSQSHSQPNPSIPTLHRNVMGYLSFFSPGLPCLRVEVCGGFSGFPLLSAHKRERGRKPAIARPDAQLKIARPAFPSSLKVTSPSPNAQSMSPNIPFWHISDGLEAAESGGRREGCSLLCKAQLQAAQGVSFAILVNHVHSSLLGV